MSSGSTSRQRAECFNCGFEAPAASDEWEATDHSALGTMTQCPDCGSTDIHVLR